MQKTLLICSDIEGTYSRLDMKDKLVFFANVSEIKEKLELDKVVFSFISTFDCKEINEIIKNDLEPIMETLDLNIVLGPMFGQDGFSYYNTGIVNKLKDNAKGLQLASYLDEFDKYIGDSYVSDFIYIDDFPNVNPVFFLLNFKNYDKSLENVTFLVKDNSFELFIKNRDYDFNIDIIKETNHNFFKTGIEKINEKTEYKKLIKYK